ncbi:hypothetical protein, partial [Streptomyces rubiginosohelvolus]
LNRDPLPCYRCGQSRGRSSVRNWGEKSVRRHQDDKRGRREALDLTALRALRESRKDVEALDLTAERLRHLQDVFTAAADRAHTTMDRYTPRDDAEMPQPGRPDDQQALRPQEPGPHRGREAGH